MYDDFFELFQQIMGQQPNSKDEPDDADGRFLVRSRNPRYAAYISAMEKQYKHKS